LEFIFNAFIYLKPVQRSEDGCDMNLLETVYLRLRKIVVERVTVVKFTVDSRGSNGTGCFRMKVRTDTQLFTQHRLVVLSEELSILESCCLRLITRNSDVTFVLSCPMLRDIRNIS